MFCNRNYVVMEHLLIITQQWSNQSLPLFSGESHNLTLLVVYCKSTANKWFSTSEITVLWLKTKKKRRKREREKKLHLEVDTTQAVGQIQLRYETSMKLIWW